MSEDIKIKHGSLQELKNVSNNDGVIYFAKDDNFLNGKIYYDDPSGEGRINVSGVGYDISGQTVNGDIAGLGAEIFNDYSERTFKDGIANEGNVASGDYSHAEGNATTASGDCSHAEGQSTIASGDFSHAEGEGTTAEGQGSHAEGYNAWAVGDYSHAEGYGQVTSGTFSHAEGFSTVVSQGTLINYYPLPFETLETMLQNAIDDVGMDINANHVEGFASVTQGLATHAEGFGTAAGGDASHAEGIGTKAIGTASHAGGAYTIAAGANQTAIGKWNRPTQDLFVVGNGIGEETRSNAFTIYEDGNIFVNDRLMFQRSNLHDSSKDTVSLIHSGGKALFVTAGIKSGNALSSGDWKVWYTTPETAKENLYFLADENMIFLPGRETLTGETQGIAIWKGIVNEKDSIILSPQRALSGSNQTDSYYTTSGHPSYRWSDIYSAKALNINSDIRLKDIQEKVVLNSLLNMYDSITPIAYKFKNLNENDNHDRIHVGLSAQEVEEKLIENKLNRLDFGGLCIDQIYEKDEDGNNTDKIIDEQYSLRYGEFHGLHILKNQQQDARIKELEDENEILKTKLSSLEADLTEIKALLNINK